MSKDFEKQSRSIADSSGFPLQLRIAQVANASEDWRVLVEEHPWSSDDPDSGGFIDLVLEEKQHGVQKMVVECKRIRDAIWVFLVHGVRVAHRSRARVWYSSYNTNKWDNFGWLERQPAPESYESKFCAIPGIEQGRRSLLDRTTSELIKATEALASDEKGLLEGRGKEVKSNGIYIPVLVTTADLAVALFDPKDVSLKDGSLPKSTVFKTVPFIRFRKSLTNKLSPSRLQTLKEVYLASERSIFIVNSEFFQDFLHKWELLE
jgi:hypothetical protein